MHISLHFTARKKVCLMANKSAFSSLSSLIVIQLVKFNFLMTVLLNFICIGTSVNFVTIELNFSVISSSPFSVILSLQEHNLHHWPIWWHFPHSDLYFCCHVKALSSLYSNKCCTFHSCLHFKDAYSPL